MFACGGQVGAHSKERGGTGGGAPTAGDLLLQFDRPDVTFGLVVVVIPISGELRLGGIRDYAECALHKPWVATVNVLYGSHPSWTITPVNDCSTPPFNVPASPRFASTWNTLCVVVDAQ